MSSNSEAIRLVLTRLRNTGAVSDRLTAIGETLHIDGRPALLVPHEARSWSWRTTVNRSLLPISVSPENRRHLLYAVLQDLIQNKLLLDENTGSLNPLADLSGELSAFDSVYRVPAELHSDRIVLFPIHVSVPTVFATYERKPEQKYQTDKGFRGRFIDFFSCDESGFFDSHLHRVLRNLFAQAEGLTPIDRALVTSLGKRVAARRQTELVDAIGAEAYRKAKDGDLSWWADVYAPVPEKSTFRPLDDFAQQGRRLHQDITAIAHTYGLSRIERVAFVERILAYHFALFLVRLTRVLYRELKWVHTELWPAAEKRPWDELSLAIRFHDKRSQVPRQFHAEYSELMEQLNEAYILLPVVNNVELAIRAVASLAAKGEQVARINDCCWVEGKHELKRMEPEARHLVREVIAFLAEMARHHAGLTEDPTSAMRLSDSPMEVLFDAVRLYYSAPDQQRYPKNHHQTVFDAVAGHGPTSFIQKEPFKHFVLGDELIYLLVLSLFEQRDDEDRQDSTCLPRQSNQLGRRRLPLREFEDRLTQDLLLPADELARRDLRSSLARLGLIDRLSDVGEGNFLRHPTGI